MTPTQPEILFELVSEFSGTPPDVPFAAGIDLDTFKTESGDTDPMFVTLPVVVEGGKSVNGFTWKAEDVDNARSEINALGVEGNFGHVPLEKRGTDYQPPALRWVGAAKIGRVLWGKAYVTSSHPTARQYFREAKATRQRVGLSVYGMRGKHGLSDMTLENVDIGHPKRLGLKEAASVPFITSEMQRIPTSKQNPGGKQMGDNDYGNDALVAELRSDRDSQRVLVSELREEITGYKATIAAFEPNKAKLDVISEMAGAGVDVVTWVKGLVSEIATLREDNVKGLRNDVISEMVKNPALRPVVLRMVDKSLTEKSAIEADVKAILESDDMKPFITEMAVNEFGPRALSGKSGGSMTLEQWKESVAEAGADAARAIGIPI